MEINGCDITVNSKLYVTPDLIQILIEDHWPKLVCEFDKNEYQTHMFVYKNEDSKRDWDEGLGSLYNMINVIFENNSTDVTFVIDDEKKNKYIVEDIRQFIKRCE